MSVRKLVPPFTRETAILKVQAAQDAWNSKDPVRCSLAYTPDSIWRNRSTFLQGREQIVKFLEEKWKSESDYHLKKHYFCHGDNTIAVTFQYEFKKDDQWYRAYGNENWTFNEEGLMAIRNASINDVKINYEDRVIGVDQEKTLAMSNGVFLK
ncbi:hypothetical protein BC833DRAFT_563281 [Globomyces pollinis-pini]|nr:hypothetical protein BC833DRAFT_563281 [Globomyces pollinis-pini]